MQDRDGKLQALLLPQGQAVGPAVRDAEQIEPFEHFLNPSRSAVLGQVKQVGMQFQVLPDGQFAIERECLRHVADAFACRHVAGIEVTPEQERLAFGRGQQAGEHLHRRALAAAVGAEKAEDLAALDAEAHVIDRSELAEALGEPLRLDGGRTVRSSRAGGTTTA